MSPITAVLSPMNRILVTNVGNPCIIAKRQRININYREKINEKNDSCLCGM